VIIWSNDPVNKVYLVSAHFGGFEVSPAKRPPTKDVTDFNASIKVVMVKQKSYSHGKIRLLNGGFNYFLYLAKSDGII
jgi:hypothetical protein